MDCAKPPSLPLSSTSIRFEIIFILRINFLSPAKESCKESRLAGASPLEHPVQTRRVGAASMPPPLVTTSNYSVSRAEFFAGKIFRWQNKNRKQLRRLFLNSNLYAAVTIILWGAMPALTKDLLNALPNFETLTLSSLFAFLFLLAVNLRGGSLYRQKKFSRRRGSDSWACSFIRRSSITAWTGFLRRRLAYSITFGL